MKKLLEEQKQFAEILSKDNIGYVFEDSSPEKEICPRCGEQENGRYKDTWGTRHCRNGHHWFRCPVHGTIVSGEPPQGISRSQVKDKCFCK